MRPAPGSPIHNAALDRADEQLRVLAASVDAPIVEVMADAMFETAASIAGWGDFRHGQAYAAERDVWRLCAWSGLLAARALKQQSKGKA
jgi:hypothetical protein